jgi:SNF2 family DNA or RNA helicase
MKMPRGFNTVGPNFYKFQYEAFLFAIERANTGLLLDKGLGKTRTAIDVARYKFQTRDTSKALVVCPNSVTYNWKKEIKKFSEYKSIVLDGTKDARLDKLKAKDPRFFIINYEFLYPMLKYLGVIIERTEGNEEYDQLKRVLRHHKYRGTLSPELAEELKFRLAHAKEKIKTIREISRDGRLKVKKLGFDMIIFDESARFIKTHDTNRTIASTILADMAKSKLILTATPIANKPMDLFAQLRAMDGGEAFGTNFWRFRNGFFENKGSSRFPNWKLKDEKVGILRSRLYKNCIRMKKEDVLDDLPPIIQQTILLEPSEDFLKNYNEAQKKVLAIIETEQAGRAVVNITSVLTKLLRLQQLTSGFAKDKITGEEKVMAMTPKLDALIEQVELVMDAEESCVVWCRFHKTMDMIEEALKKKKIRCVTMSGKDSGKQKYAKWTGFQKDKNLNVFIGQVEAGGIGIELFKEDSIAEKHQHMFFYENTWSLDVRDQAEGRIHRIGQNSTCVYVDVIMNGTIDVKIRNVLKENQEIADYILDHGVSHFLKAA